MIFRQINSKFFAKAAIKKHWLLTGLACSVMWLSISHASEQFAAKMSPPEHKQFVVEQVYNYSRSKFEKPVVVVPVARANASDATPEDAFVSFISAMKARDYDWWISCWTTKSQEFIKAQNQEKKRSSETWISSWDAVLKDREIVLWERIETGHYVLFVYSLRMIGPIGKETFRSIYAAQNEGGHWLATQELEKDPLFNHYLEGKDKFTTIIR